MSMFASQLRRVASPISGVVVGNEYWGELIHECRMLAAVDGHVSIGELVWSPIDINGLSSSLQNLGDNHVVVRCVELVHISLVHVSLALRRVASQRMRRWNGTRRLTARQPIYRTISEKTAKARMRRRVLCGKIISAKAKASYWGCLWVLQLTAWQKNEQAANTQLLAPLSKSPLNGSKSRGKWQRNGVSQQLGCLFR